MVITTKHHNITISSLNPFTWTTTRIDRQTPSRIAYYHPVDVDWTDSVVANYEMLEGVYRSEKAGMKLAGFAARTIINKPLQFMGIPIPKSDNENTQKIMSEWVLRQQSNIKDNHRESHLQGTSWVFPFFNPAIKDVTLEFLPDNIVNVIRDVLYRQILKIETDEYITVGTGIDSQSVIRRYRTFTPQEITIRYEGDLSILGDQKDLLKSQRYRNIFNIMPIPFANNKKAGDVRGYSDLVNALPDMKAYHDIDLKISTILAKFNPKFCFGVADVEQWKTNNSVTDINKLDLAIRDLFFYIKDSEDKPEVIFNQALSEPYLAMLNNYFKKIVEDAGIPEMFWGIKMTGNHASAQENMSDMIRFVHDKQDQHLESYNILLNNVAALKNLAGMIRNGGIVKTEWNALDAISEDIKAKIFADFAAGLSKLFEGGGLTIKQLYNFYVEMYPKATEDTYEEFEKNLTRSAQYRQYVSASLMDAAGMKGFDDMPEKPESVQPIIPAGNGEILPEAAI